jgi:hypothetical protein
VVGRGADVTRPAGYLDGRVALDGCDCIISVVLAFEKRSGVSRGCHVLLTLNHVLS